MATLDWPTTRAFRGAQFALGVDVARSGAQGFYTSERQTVSHLADRWRGMLTLPPCLSADAYEREAYLMGALSRGDHLRMVGLPHMQAIRGNMRGTPTASAGLAGARSLVINGATAGANLLLGGGFEADANGDALCDNLTAYQSGSATGVTYYRIAGNGSTYGQGMGASTMGTTSADMVGLLFTALVPVVAAQTYTMAADVRGSHSGLSVRLYWEWVNAALATIIGSSTSATSLPLTFTRVVRSEVAPTGAVWARCYVWMQANTGAHADVGMVVDNVQFQAGTESTFSGLARLSAGDLLGVGGNLIQCDYGGAVENAAGQITVPLTMPLPAAVSNGAAVTWNAPTGLWQIDADGMQLDYSAPVVQGGIAIPLRQVLA